jgi:hypothetical protein
MDWQALAVYVAAVAAICSALSAAANLYNTGTFHRQLRNTTVDACVAAAVALKAAVHKAIEHKENKEDKITPERIQGAYDDTWNKWVAFHQAFRIAQRYNKGLDFDAPDETSRLLSELRISLRDTTWTPGGASDVRDIREAMDKIVDLIQSRTGLSQR